MSLTTIQNKKTPFQAIITRGLKSRKIAIFLKGLTHGFGPKMVIFLTSFFQAIQARKMSLTIFQNKRTPFQAIKTRSSKSRKIAIFPKGLTHGFGPKMALFFNFFFLSNIGQEKLFYDILERKNASLGYKNKNFKKSKNCHFSKGVNLWFWYKNSHLFNLFSLGNKGHENDFYDILERKNAFVGYKNKKLKKSKNCHFSKGVNPWFWSKNGHFLNFFFQAIQARKKRFTTFQNKKTPFQAIKTRS